MVFKKNTRVKCPYCNKNFIREYEDEKLTQPLNFVFYKQRYYHIDCYKKKKTIDEKITQQRQDIFNFLEDNYKGTKKLNYPFINKQISQQLSEGLKLSGILGTLHYFKDNRPDYDFSSIGLVPYYYEKAKKYYQDQQKYENMKIKHHKIMKKEINILPIKNKKKEKWRLD